MLFKNIFNREKQNEISKEEFGERILSRIILLTGENSKEVFEKLEKELTFGDYLIYLQYHLFLAQKILEERYYLCDVQEIIDATIIGLIEFSNVIAVDKKDEVKQMFKEWYVETSDYLKDIDIHEKQGLQELVTCFMQDTNIPKDFYYNLDIWLQFSGFIIHHTNDILNDKILIRDCSYKHATNK